MNLLIKGMRHNKVRFIIGKLNQVLTGYYHYYGVTDNSRCIHCFYDRIKGILFNWLNRRSQHRSYTWEGYIEMLKCYPLAKPKIYVSMYA